MSTTPVLITSLPTGQYWRSSVASSAPVINIPAASAGDLLILHGALVLESHYSSGLQAWTEIVTLDNTTSTQSRLLVYSKKSTGGESMALTLQLTSKRESPWYVSHPPTG